jgi:hypothetical protein
VSAKTKKRTKRSPAAARAGISDGAERRFGTSATPRAARDAKPASGTFPVATQDEVDGPLMLELANIQSQMTILLDALLAADQDDACMMLDDMRERLDRATNEYDARVLAGRPAKRQALIGGAS